MRYAERFPLPSYRHVPGQTPHPLSDPNGHGMMGLKFDCQPVELDRWRESAAYCYALDLFNSGFYWEAHEVWEGLWRAAGRSGHVADFLKGLIKLAAAQVKAREGRPAGVRRHGRRAGELFAAVRAARGDRNSPPLLGGLALEELAQVAAQLARSDGDGPPFQLDPR